MLAQARQRRVSRLRLSGGEPTLGKAHLLGVLERVDGHGYSFILETNGLPIGQDPVAPALARYRDLHVRVSLRAGSAAGFQARTDAFYQGDSVLESLVNGAVSTRHRVYLPILLRQYNSW